MPLLSTTFLWAANRNKPSEKNKYNREMDLNACHHPSKRGTADELKNWIAELNTQLMRHLSFRSAAWVMKQILDSLRLRANARNVSFRISLRRPIHIINPVDKTQLCAPKLYLTLFHIRNSTTRVRDTLHRKVPVKYVKFVSKNYCMVCSPICKNTWKSRKPFILVQFLTLKKPESS